MRKPKDIRANLVTASLVVIAACLAGPHVVRGVNAILDYGPWVLEREQEQECRSKASRIIRLDGNPIRPDGQPVLVFKKQYKECLEFWKIREELRPINPKGAHRPDQAKIDPGLDVWMFFFQDIPWCLSDGNCDYLIRRFGIEID